MKNLVIVELDKMTSIKCLKSFNGRNIVLTILLLLASFSLNAQTGKVISVNDFLANQSASTTSSNSETVSKLKNYLKDLKPTIYVSNNIVTQKSENALSLNTDVKSIRTINSVGINNNSIEYVLIKIKSKNDIISPIDLSVFNEFANLKYIVLEFEFEVSRSAAEMSARDANENQYVLYKVEIQS